jgi:CHAT domain-containing protein
MWVIGHAQVGWFLARAVRLGRRDRVLVTWCAAREASEVARAWRRHGGFATHLQGMAASEAAFKSRAPGHLVLHLATHGFVVGEGCGTARASARGVEVTSTLAGAAPAQGGENPLLLSGLALAGANHRMAADLDEEDGVLMAGEIASLDLAGVEWAVLSACDTGRGAVQAGEGVLGLRRAFQVAGARTAVMSLWAADDEATRQWMRALYDARLGLGLDTAECVRAASLSVLRSRRAKGVGMHPLSWGGFVAAGDWR